MSKGGYTSEHLAPAYENMLKCGLSKEKANQEIGFALDQINAKPTLFTSDLMSVNNAVSQVAYTGLSLSPLKDEAVISDYSEKKVEGACFLPMYRGLLKVAIADGSIIAANTQIIKEGDDYEINAASFKNPVKHIVKIGTPNAKSILGYCVLLLPNGVEQVTLFYLHEYEQLKPKGGKFSPHTNWGDEMWKKSTLKRALKTVSSNGDSKLDHLIALDNFQYSMQPIKDNAASNATLVENKKPILDKRNKRYQKAVIAIATGKADMDKVKSVFNVPDYVQVEIEKEVEALILENEKKAEHETV